jgi:predicted metallo-beta-lactamase superfamily hydrolase
MQIIPLAADSMGVRSMATFVESRDAGFLIDPGAVLAERRRSLPPRPLETDCLRKALERISLFVKNTRVIVITRWDPEHVRFESPEWMKGKRLLVKNPNLSLSPERRTRAFEFLKTVRNLCEEIVFADGCTFAFGASRITFGDFIPAGPADSREASIPLAVMEGDETFAFSSAAKGVYPEPTALFLASAKPAVLYLDGPDTNPAERTIRRPAPAPLIRRMRRLIAESGSRRILYDHHPIRDPEWRRKAEPLFQAAMEQGAVLQTAAEYRGEEILELESRRKSLFDLECGGPATGGRDPSSEEDG